MPLVGAVAWAGVRGVASYALRRRAVVAVARSRGAAGYRARLAAQTGKSRYRKTVPVRTYRRAAFSSKTKSEIERREALDKFRKKAASKVVSAGKSYHRGKLYRVNISRKMYSAGRKELSRARRFNDDRRRRSNRHW